MVENLTSNHILAFGGITYNYAKIEGALEIIISDMLNIDVGTTVIITEPYSSLDLRNVIKALNKLIALPNNLNEELAQIVGDLQSFGSLRNNIAHNTWTDGDRPGSIKPMRMNIRSGKPVPTGHEEGEQDHTADELQNKVNELKNLHDRVRRFIVDSGAAERIELKMAQSILFNDPDGGISAT